MLGDTDQILGSVPQNAGIIQQQELLPEKLGMERASEAQAPDAAAGKERALKQVNQVTISPQMAKGLEKMTGQKWDQTVGTKWDPNIFTAIVTGMSQAKYHQDVMTGKVNIEGMKEEAGKAKQEQSAEDKAKYGKDLEDLKAKHAKELEQLKEQFKATHPSGSGKGGTKAPPDPETQGRQLLDAINKATKAGDEANKKSAVANYNDFAQKNNLAPYKEEPGFFESALSAIKSLGGKGGQDDNVGQYLKQNGIKDTPANRKWAESKVNAEK